MIQKLAVFHIGRGGRFNNPGFLTFCGCNLTAKHQIEQANFLGYENEFLLTDEYGVQVIEDLFNLNYKTEGDDYRAFVDKYGNPGGIVVRDCDGNTIGDYVSDDDKEFYYDEDGEFDTTYSRSVSCWDDFSEREQEAILRCTDRFFIEELKGIEIPPSNV